MASQPAGKWTIYTVGYEGVDPKILFSAFKELKIKTLLDVRAAPNNQTTPHYKLCNLKQLSEGSGIKYVWRGQEFGGVHQTQALIAKLCDNEFESGSFLLRSTFSLVEHPVVVLCAENSMEKCVRRHIADALIKWGLAEIQHITFDATNKLAVSAYTMDTKQSKITIGIEEKTEPYVDDEKQTAVQLPNDVVAVNTGIVSVNKPPEQLSKSDVTGFKAAFCIIPSTEIWPKIQEIRKKYDAAYKRWQPHLNLAYPFVNEQLFAAQVSHIERALSKIEPFEIQFNRFNFFDKGGSDKEPDPLCYVFLQPSPIDALQQLQKVYDAMIALYPFCKSKKHNQGFTGHLTVGQFPKSKCKQYVTILNAEWKPISFRCEHVCLIARTGDDNPFEIRYKIKMGTAIKTPFV